jgi:hypothetical protein
MLSSTYSTIAWSFLVDFQIDGPAGEETRVSVDQTKVNVSTLRHCNVGDGMDAEKEPTVVYESDLSWLELVAIQYSVHQKEVPKPLEGCEMGLQGLMQGPVRLTTVHHHMPQNESNSLSTHPNWHVAPPPTTHYLSRSFHSIA